MSARAFARARASAVVCLRSRASAVRHLSAPAAQVSESYVTSIYPPIPAIAETANITDFVMASWPSLGNKLAIVDGITGAERTFAQLSVGVNALAAHLAATGLQHGDRIALVSANHPDYATVLLAAIKLGVVVSPMNPTLTAAEMAVQLRDANIKLVVAHPDCTQAMEAAADTSPAFGTLTLGPALDTILESGAAAPPNPPAMRAQDVAVLPYSSGTTGVPKGTMLSHRNIIANLHQIVPCDGAFYGPDDVLISPLPMFHIYPLTVGLLFHLWRGHTYVSMSGPFSVANLCRLTERYRATRAHVAPPVVLQLAKSTDVDVAQLATLNMVLSAAAPLYASLEEECAARIGSPVKQAWGMSELSPLGTMVPDDALRGGSLGLAVPDTEIKLVAVDEDGEIDHTAPGVPVGQEGELLIRGPQVMLGYLNAPGKTAECMPGDGWLRTGDIAKMDEGGYLYITDRLKELIKYKGHQVAPAELEDLISSHPKISDAAVIPVLDEEAGELPRAYVVPKPGETVSPEEVVAFVAERVSAFKKLRGGAVITDSIPKTGSGKILRRLVMKADREKAAAA